MKHKIMVGKPITKDGEIVGYKEVKEIPTNQVFNFNRRGFKAIPEDDEPAAEEGTENTSKKKSVSKKDSKKVTAAKESSKDGDQDLSQLTVKELRAIAEPLGVKGKTKADLVSAIESAQKDTADE